MIYTVFVRKKLVHGVNPACITYHPKYSVALVLEGEDRGSSADKHHYYRLHCEFPDGPPADFVIPTTTRRGKLGLWSRLVDTVKGLRIPREGDRIVHATWQFVTDREPADSLLVCPEAFTRIDPAVMRRVISG